MPITRENVYPLCQLSQNLSQVHRKMVADNAISLAQAYVTPKAEPRAIYEDDQLIGFIMMHYGPEDGEVESDDIAYLWRFMISAKDQGKGYGQAVLHLVFEEVKARGYNELITSCGQGDGSPLMFYKKLGFEETGEIDEGEIVLKIMLT